MTIAEFKAAFPEFASEKDEVLTRHLLTTDTHGDESRWESGYDIGQGWLTAHNLVMEKQRMAEGMLALAGDVLSVTQETPAGRVSQSRGDVSMQITNPYMRTIYGQQYYCMLIQAGMGAVAC